VRRALRAFGLAYPGAHTKSPWPGHLDLAVRDKTFTYLNVDGEPLSISCKLPHSAEVALMLPNAKPTAYGLGRSGWVTADFGPEDDPPLEMLKSWIDESYRAQAPRRLVAALSGASSTARPSPAPKRAARKSPASRASGRKAKKPSPNAAKRRPGRR